MAVVIYLDYPTAIVVGLLALYGLEHLFVRMIRIVDRRTRAKKKPTPPPSTIVLP